MKIEVDKTSGYELSALLKSKNFVRATANIKDRTGVEVRVTVDSLTPSFKEVLSGEHVYSWDIEALLFEFKIDSRMELDEPIVFDEPIGFDILESVIPYGEYVCKYISIRTMSESIDILNHNPHCGSVGGSFVFDLVRNYKILSLVKIK